MDNTPVIEITATALFALAIVHTFSSGYIAHLGQRFPAHSGLWHLLGEVEVVFGFWASLLILFMFLHSGKTQAVDYINSCDFTEPLFVFAIMVVAASRPVTSSVRNAVFWLARQVARPLPVPEPLLLYFFTLSVIPLFGSLITEPAAMTLAALILRDAFLSRMMPQRAKYATLAVLLVNVSVGGVLTPYAAPPVLMVAGTWGWDLSFMLSTFGWRSVLIVVVNALFVSFLFRRAIVKMASRSEIEETQIPLIMRAIHFLFLAIIVYFSHHPVIFIPLLLFFLGLAGAYPHYQDKQMMLRESMLVAFFLAGLVVLGKLQAWWLQPTLEGMSPNLLFWGVMPLSAITDNAAITYLGSLVEGTDAAFRYSLVAGAIAAGGLTVIANAPNPAGIAILKGRFEDDTVNPLKLFIAALGPTLFAALVFFV